MLKPLEFASELALSRGLKFNLGNIQVVVWPTQHWSSIILIRKVELKKNESFYAALDLFYLFHLVLLCG